MLQYTLSYPLLYMLQLVILHLQYLRSLYPLHYIPNRFLFLYKLNNQTPMCMTGYRNCDHLHYRLSMQMNPLMYICHTCNSKQRQLYKLHLTFYMQQMYPWYCKRDQVHYLFQLHKMNFWDYIRKSISYNFFSLLYMLQLNIERPNLLCKSELN